LISSAIARGYHPRVPYEKDTKFHLKKHQTFEDQILKLARNDSKTNLFVNDYLKIAKGTIFFNIIRI